jgi:hypothetical protein
MKQFTPREVEPTLVFQHGTSFWRKQMRKGLLAVAISAGLIGTAFAQPSTNGPSGTGPEGSPPGVVSGSGKNPPGAVTSGHGMSSKMTRHHTTHKSHQKM